MAALLDDLTARNLPLAIVSNKPDRMTKLLARDMLARWRWGHIAGQSSGIPRKPDPAMALQAANSLLRSALAGFEQLGARPGMSKARLALEKST